MADPTVRSPIAVQPIVSDAARALTAAAAASPDPKDVPRTPVTITTDEGAAVHVYPPFAGALRDRASAVVVMLHGMGGDPERTCDFWSDEARASGWLLCPQGNVGCCGTFDWKGDGETKARFVDSVLHAARDAFGARAAVGSPAILAGFSRGAFVARDVIYARPGVFDAAIFLGADLNPDPARFKAAGIRRVVLGSGDFDGARRGMQRSAEALRSGGVPAKFVSLGPLPHALPADLGPILADAIGWLRDGPDGS